MGVTTQVFIRHRITAIADVFTTRELRRDVTIVGTFGQRQSLVDRSEVAREIAGSGQSES